jgi:hypothetical protein
MGVCWCGPNDIDFVLVIKAALQFKIPAATLRKQSAKKSLAKPKIVPSKANV